MKLRYLLLSILLALFSITTSAASESLEGLIAKDHKDKDAPPAPADVIHWSGDQLEQYKDGSFDLLNPSDEIVLTVILSQDAFGALALNDHVNA